jgi:hypothetical protein
VIGPSRLRSVRQARADLQYALGSVSRPNPVVFAWRWRYELALAAGLPVAAIALAARLGTAQALGTILAVSLLAGAATLWPAARHHLVARAWCIITPHRIRSGCAQAWIHSRYGKIPVVLLTTRESFGERVRVWCRAGTSAEDFISARHLLVAACWAEDIQVMRSPRYAQLVTIDVIRRAPGGMSSGPGAESCVGVETPSPEMPEGHLNGHRKTPSMPDAGGVTWRS